MKRLQYKDRQLEVRLERFCARAGRKDPNEIHEMDWQSDNIARVQVQRALVR